MVGGIDARPQPWLVVADVFDGDIGLQARDADTRSARLHRMTEPAAVTSVPGPHVDLPLGTHNPYRHGSAPCPVGAVGGDAQLFGPADSLQLVRRPRDGHDAELLHQMTVPVGEESKRRLVLANRTLTEYSAPRRHGGVDMLGPGSRGV